MQKRPKSNRDATAKNTAIQQEDLCQSLHALIDDLRSSDHDRRCDLIRAAFKVNDVIAECSSRHLAVGLQQASRLEEDIEQFLSSAKHLPGPNYQAMLGQVFGIHGRAAMGVLVNLGWRQNTKPS